MRLISAFLSKAISFASSTLTTHDGTINAMISDLQGDFDLTDEGDVEVFLGIKLQSNS